MSADISLARWRRGLLACLATASLVAVANPVGQIVALSGKGEYREDPARPWTPAALKQAVVAKSSLRTGDASAMSILLADNAQIKLGQNTVFEVQAISAPPAPTQVMLKSGRAWGQIKQPPAGFTMQTPAVAAGIHGTDWVMEVDETGRSTLTVLSGQIELSNPYGSVQVGAGEEGSAAVGQAPVKRQLVNARERVQWVAAYRLDPRRYPELAQAPYAALATLIRGNDAAGALHWLAQARAAQPVPADWLIASELELGRGNKAAAAGLLQDGSARYPDEPRFAIARARLALYEDDVAQAAQLAVQVTVRHPEAVDGWLAAGEVARVGGDGPTAEHAYHEATTRAPDDPRTWLGAGATALERDATRTARTDLAAANARAGTPNYAAAELGTYYAYTDAPAEARIEFKRALAADPADYVAWTGLGVAQLKGGQDGDALQSLLRANTIEPKYARAVTWLAVAYYRAGKVLAARQTLQRASELDPNDPLPAVLAAMIARDQRAAGDALAAAREAAAKMPKLKSLNQVADDQQGSANIGATLADMGLDAWANHYAQSSYYPYWGGSHLFLAQRYEGDYGQTSELLAGFLADPTAFGADPARQNLLPQPGAYGELQGQRIGSKALDLNEYSFTGNGYDDTPLPFAWFGQGSRTQITPGNAQIAADANNAVLGAGAKLTPELSLFGFASHFHIASVIAGQPDSLNDNRVDAGMSYRLGPQSQLWLRMGSIDQNEQQIIPPPDPIYFGNTPRTRSVSLRHTFNLDGGSEISYGFEGTRRRGGKSEFAPSDLGTVIGAEQHEDRSSDGWVALRQHLGRDWRIDAQLDWSHYRKTRHSKTDVIAGGVDYPVEDNHDDYARSRVDPRIGLVYAPSPGFAIRSAWQRWQRPYGSGGLEPVTTADIPLPDQFVLPGGVMRRWRLQMDWEFTPRQFVSLFADRIDVQNIVFGDLSIDGLPVENVPMGVPELDSLLGDALFAPTRLGTLGATPVFSAGRIDLGGAQYNALLWPHTAIYLSLLHIHSRNTTSDFAGFPLPGLRERSALAGIAWAEGNWTANGELIYGSRFPIDESSAWNDAVPETRQAVFRGGWRSDNRRWQLYLIGRHTEGGGADNLFGMEAKLRF